MIFTLSALLLGGMQTGFVGNASDDMVRVTISGNPCVYTADGKFITLTELSDRSVAWEKSGRQVDLRIDPYVSPMCPKAVLKTFKRYPSLQIGFLGNDNLPRPTK